MKKFIIFAALLTILGGCSSWHNHNITDPEMAKKRYKEDRTFCTKRTAQQHPIGPKNDNGSRMLTSDRVKFSENHKATSTYNACMESRGWVKK
ncbi:hypothetical protein SAMN05660337_3370 [Maridesulfovibrio ferrireducens]|uniref:Lipoprotein n=1 Tax=Maridesulfovibrio ferrireducens TaxID=246191 RepID=A0A1G9LG97_9BACT|nr:hypothetical protein [Maridesulfovibrio ferrireducens]SDL60904.1 hypothetical protein SAMN05660337_3370 [Maridesulfovibrio ferrireducens]